MRHHVYEYRTNGELVTHQSTKSTAPQRKRYLRFVIHRAAEEGEDILAAPTANRSVI
jgi:hypothetical protein